jgi:hypothetical protein
VTTKAELIEEAEAMGVVVDDEDTVDDIEAKMAAARGANALGAHVDDDDEPTGFEQVGNGKAVQPETYDDVPEAFR